MLSKKSALRALPQVATSDGIQVMEKHLNLICVSSLFFLLAATYFMIPTLTSLYYYAWGEHLDWAYFDGPPMIAYLFYLSRHLFGLTYFSINVVGFFCFIGSLYFIYRLGCLLKNERVGLMSALIWATLPLSIENVFIRAVYDAPLNLFTVMTLYYFARYQKQASSQFLYQCAIALGCMILSKFTAVVTVVAIVFYLLSQYREVFRKGHFYGACIVLLLMLAPLFYWNFQHQWVTVKYLLSFHSQSNNKGSIGYSLMKLLFTLFANFSVYLVMAHLSVYQYQKRSALQQEKNVYFECIATVFFVSLMFWFVVVGAGGEPRAIYLTPLGINMALLSAYAMHEYAYQRVFKVFFPIFLCLAMGAVLANMWPLGLYLRKGITYSLIKRISSGTHVIKKNEPILTGSYTSAAILHFFLPQHPVYTLPCNESNQYQYWSASFLKSLSEGNPKTAMYIDFEDTKPCALQSFSQCRLVMKSEASKTIPIIAKKTKPVHLYLYECEK